MQYTILATSTGTRTIQALKADATKHPAVLAKALSRLAYFGQQDSKESAKAQLDRPTNYTLKAIKFSKAKPTHLRSAVFVNPNNEYLHRVVFGGVRTNRGRILVPARELRSNPYGNLSRARRRNILKHPKTFIITKGGNKYIMRRLRKKLEFIAVLEKATFYRKKWWKFHESNLKTYEKRFGGLFNQEFDRAMKKR